MTIDQHNELVQWANAAGVCDDDSIRDLLCIVTRISADSWDDGRTEPGGDTITEDWTDGPLFMVHIDTDGLDQKTADDVVRRVTLKIHNQDSQDIEINNWEVSYQ